MKEAMYYEKREGEAVRCKLCPRKCAILPGKRGDCKVRENRKGVLYSLVYGKPCSVAVDPIEKKPLFHFFPGTTAFSVGTAGCNLHCQCCQNWTTAQANPEEVISYEVEPKEVVRRAAGGDCKSISYTYNEPSIFFEYVLDTAKMARKKGIKNTMVTNGFINKEPAKELYKYIDAANVDLKAFSEDFYRKYCFAELKPVLDLLKITKEEKVWVEITNLIIPTLNDNPKMIGEMCSWIVRNLGEEVPLHFSRFYPHYRLSYIPPTSEKTLLEAKKIAEKSGIKYVYIGNTSLPGVENTYCPKCKKLAVERTIFSVKQNNVQKGACKFCKEKIAGVWGP